MENALKPVSKGDITETALIMGDLSKLSPDQRMGYYNKLCESLGVNPLTKPFEYITLNGKLTLYAKKDLTDQLRSLKNVSVKITSRDTQDSVIVVTAQATLPSGRCDESVGAVNIGGLKGDSLANAYMKAETKAKRRVTLSICGLGMLDESEISSIPEVRISSAKEKRQEIPPKLTDWVGDYVIPIGKKFKGQKLKDLPANDLYSFSKWLRDQEREKGEALHGLALELVEHIDVYLDELRTEVESN